MVCMESGAGGLLDSRKGDAHCLAPCIAKFLTISKCCACC